MLQGECELRILGILPLRVCFKRDKYPLLVKILVSSILKARKGRHTSKALFYLTFNTNTRDLYPFYGKQRRRDNSFAYFSFPFEKITPVSLVLRIQTGDKRRDKG